VERRKKEGGRSRREFAEKRDATLPFPPRNLEPREKKNLLVEKEKRRKAIIRGKGRKGSSGKSLSRVASLRGDLAPGTSLEKTGAKGDNGVPGPLIGQGGDLLCKVPVAIMKDS